MAIGFNTPSKRLAEAQEKENNAQKLPTSGVAGMNLDKLKAETIERINQLGSVICSDNFQKYPPQQRQQILLDFAYYSKVADSVL